MNYQPQVQASCYEKNVFHPLRIHSVTEQIRLLSEYGVENVLEIGIGKGLIKHFLKAMPHVQHTCIDIAPDLQPDVIGSVLKMPFEYGQFDCVLCCQVLEHLRFEDFGAALREIRRVTRKLAVISVPDTRRRFGLGACLFKYGWKKYEFNFERRSARNEKLIDEHHWEIGHRRTTGMKKIKSEIHQAGFRMLKNYRLEQFEWHCFFVLQPEII